MSESSSSPAERHRRIAAGFSAVVLGVAHDGWDAPTPVSGWTARDVVGHLVEWLPGLLSAGSEVHLPAGPLLADDPAAAWAHHRDEVQAVLDDPERASSAFSHPHIGDLTVSEAIDRLYTSDVFMHTWDLARSSGQDDRLDPELCEELLSGMAPMEDLLRSSGQYGAAFPVPSDAPPHLRLAAFIGRDPRWQP